MSKSPPQTPEFISIGRISRPHGIRGELVVRLYNDASVHLHEKPTLRIGTTAESSTAYEVKNYRPQHGKGLLALHQCTTRDAAEALRGQEIWVATKELPLPAEGEYYHFQLIGMQVLTADNQQVGVVTGVEQNPGADNLVLQGKDKKFMVPLIADAIDHIDLEQRCITLTTMEGLLDHGF